MQGLQIVTLVIQLVTLGILGWALFTLHRASRYQKQLTKSLQSRQQTMTVRSSAVRAPAIDSRARTTRRDTGDLPLTGRQSRVAQTRRGGDLLDRVDHDDQLQFRTGGPPA